MTTPSPTPDAALTEEEREAIEGNLRWHFNVVADEGKGSLYASAGIQTAINRFERILAARTAALTERLAEVEGYADHTSCVESYTALLNRETALRAVVAELVALKDGPRDADYERRKPLAWDAARAALATSATTEQAGTGAQDEAGEDRG